MRKCEDLLVNSAPRSLVQSFCPSSSDFLPVLMNATSPSVITPVVGTVDQGAGQPTSAQDSSVPLVHLCPVHSPPPIALN